MALSLRLGKIPVRIAPSFFLMAALLGMYSADLRILVAWVLVVLVSVTLHELGHATMGRAFGLEPRIDLHGMGGTTSWAAPGKLSTWQRVAISLAGPGAGFLVAAIVTALHAWLLPHAIASPSLGGSKAIAEIVYDQLLWVNFGWGIVNLLPMLPLDGGNVMAQLLTKLAGARGERLARFVSIAVAGLAALWAFGVQQWWPALLAISFVATNWRGIKDLTAREHDAPMRLALDQAYAALDAKDGARVLELVRSIALESRTVPVRAEALQLLAFGFLLEGRLADGDAAIAALPKGYSPHPSLLELRASLAAGARP
jgi:Zn-dependent protease